MSEPLAGSGFIGTHPVFGLEREDTLADPRRGTAVYRWCMSAPVPPVEVDLDALHYADQFAIVMPSRRKTIIKSVCFG